LSFGVRPVPTEERKQPGDEAASGQWQERSKPPRCVAFLDVTVGRESSGRWARRHVPFLLIEHHLPFVLEHCDLLSVLELGSTTARGTPKSDHE
jgi:hypothetical protein